ncbi:protein of unassigned function [Methylobacterium oryzae CBMB20]|uniref:Protein of unassigned function n=1 Tax=Methylobacterium oryzae CBMB20 TaxID=693986 RepID=A0A089NM30_9HYPH|nr:protein of unassigned function [Methylobacterium oryzae CBMB20]
MRDRLLSFVRSRPRPPTRTGPGLRRPIAPRSGRVRIGFEERRTARSGHAVRVQDPTPPDDAARGRVTRRGPGLASRPRGSVKRAMPDCNAAAVARIPRLSVCASARRSWRGHQNLGIPVVLPTQCTCCPQRSDVSAHGSRGSGACGAVASGAG